jgi:hypothetical protein
MLAAVSNDGPNYTNSRRRLRSESVVSERFGCTPGGGREGVGVGMSSGALIMISTEALSVRRVERCTKGVLVSISSGSSEVGRFVTVYT